MSRPNPAAHARLSADPRLLSGAFSLGVLWLILNAATAIASDEIDLRDHAIEARVDAAKSVRATSLATIELPMRIRALFHTRYTEDLYFSDRLARPYALQVGPDLRVDRSIENRFALTRAISDKVEIGIAWGTRGPISNVGFFDLERQTLRATLRIVP